MRVQKSFICAALLFVLAACGQPDAAKQESGEAPAAAGPGFETYAGGQAPLLSAGYHSEVIPTTWFICDADNATDVFVASTPDASGAFQLGRYNKTNLQPELMNVTLGDPIDAPRGPARGFADPQGTFGVIYTLAASTMSGPDAATTAPVISLDLNGEEFNCTWLEHIRMIGFTGYATYIVWGADANIQLYVFPFADTEAPLMVELEHGEQGLAPGITAEHGVEQIDAANETTLWIFPQASDGKAYRIHTVVDAPATVQYEAIGEVGQTDELYAYALARR